LVLDYSYYYFNIIYSGVNRTSGDNYLVCPQNASIEINAWYASAGVLFETTLWPGAKNDLRPINEVSEYTLDEFYNLFINPNSPDCLKVNKNVW
jgi:hypothetical protein